MRFLIVAVALLACAAAAPSGALLAAPYASGIIGAAPWGLAAAPVAVAGAVPAGDIQGAAIDATVRATDSVRAVVDQANELQGRAINNAEGHAWQALSAVQTAQAQVDGAAASVAPGVARSLVSPVAAYAAAPAVVAPAVAAYAAAPAVVAPAVAAYSAAPVVAARAIAAPAVIAGSQSISTQSLSQTHPVPLVSAPVAYGVHAW